MMKESTQLKVNLFGAWCAVIYCVLLIIGWWVIGGFLPLHAPSAGAQEIAAFFRQDVMSIRLGMVLVMWGAAAFIPFTSTVADYVSRVEGRVGPLTRIVTLSGYSNVLLTFYPPLWWLANTWRSDERPDEMIYMINDVAWLQFIGGLSIALPMFLVVSFVAFCDKSARPVFPRWSGYVSFWAFVLMLPDQMLFFFKTGPFAWDGLFSFWLPASTFLGWFLFLFYLIRRSIVAELKTLRS